MRVITIFILCFLVLVGCEKIYFKNQPTNAAEENFEIFWNDFDHYYGQFDIRHINWDSVYTVYRPQVNSKTTNEELFVILNDIVQLLKDGHVNLYASSKVASYTNLFPSGYFGDRLVNATNYISFSSLRNTALECGTLNAHNIGYIRIITFYSNDFGTADTRYTLIDEILEQFKDKDGIIIDVRGNGGGNSTNAIKIASRFADKRYLYYKQRYKNGPAKNDFSWVNFYLEPQGVTPFTKPIVVLTSRYTYSSAELFTAAMRILPQVTLVGDTTGGGIGNPVYRELLNGWSYRLSTSAGALPNGSIIDGSGIAPMITIVTTEQDAAPENNKDAMLEKAIEVID